jgi:hypothetical protein
VPRKKKASTQEPPKDLAGFIAKYDGEVARRIRLFNIRDVEEVKWDFYERLLDQKVFEKYDQTKISNWESRPAVQNFERYIFHILRTVLINRSNHQRLVDSRIVSVEAMATTFNEDDEGDSEPFFGGVEDAVDASKAPFSLEDILDICHVFPPRMYREVRGEMHPVSVEAVAKLYAEGNSETEVAEKMRISAFMLEALLADLRVVASMLQVRMRGMLGGGGAHESGR